MPPKQMDGDEVDDADVLGVGGSSPFRLGFMLRPGCCCRHSTENVKPTAQISQTLFFHPTCWRLDELAMGGSEAREL